MSTYETIPWGSNHLLELNGIGSLGHIMTKDKGYYVCLSINPSSVQRISLISTIKPTVLEGIYTNFPIQGSPPVEQIKKTFHQGFDLPESHL